MNKQVYGLQVHATGSWKCYDIGDLALGEAWLKTPPKECVRHLFPSREAREKVLDEEVRPKSPAGRWIQSDAGRASVEAAYERMTGKRFADAFATTHNGAKVHPWAKILGCVLGHSDRTRAISGGVRIADLLEAAKCPK